MSAFPATGGVSGPPEISDERAERRSPTEEAGHAGVLRAKRAHGRAALTQAAALTTAPRQGGGDGDTHAEARWHAPGHPQDREGPKRGVFLYFKLLSLICLL